MSEEGLLRQFLMLLPRFVDLLNMWLAGGKDPSEELEKLFKTADIAADTAEQEKFGQ